MQKQQEELNMGVLDIYGFEIFQVSTHISHTQFSSTKHKLKPHYHSKT